MHLSDNRGYSVLEVLFAAAISATLAAVAIPMSRNSVGYFRLSGDARSVSNAVALTKMRAASAFSQARLYVDLTTRSHHIETYTKGVGFSGSQGATGLSQECLAQFGLLSTPPPNTQAVIGQAPACLTSAGTAIANTACIVFNSRGIPINCTSIVLDQGCSPAAPTADDAFYLTDRDRRLRGHRRCERDDSDVAECSVNCSPGSSNDAGPSLLREDCAHT